VLVRHARDNSVTRVDATPEAAKAWTNHVIETNEGLLFTEVDSWMTGINRNLEGKQVRRVMRYSGGHPAFRRRCEAVSAGGYRGDCRWRSSQAAGVFADDHRNGLSRACAAAGGRLQATEIGADVGSRQIQHLAPGPLVLLGLCRASGKFSVRVARERYPAHGCLEGRVIKLEMNAEARAEVRVRRGAQW
jgi:hypothetical protein